MTFVKNGAEIQGRNELTEHLLAVCESMPDCVITTDHRGVVWFANRAARALLGIASDDTVGGADIDVLSHLTTASLRRLRRECAAAFANQDSWTGVVTLADAGGRRRDVSVVVIAHRDQSGTPVRFSGVARDISNLKLADELAESAIYDRLTGAAGRDLLADRLTQCAQRSERSGASFAVLFCDLDGFKVVNDLFGHASGDLVLVEVTRRLKRLVRASDTIARLGGDEFVIVVDGLDAPARAQFIAQRIVDSLPAAITLPTGVATVGVSIGIAIGLGASEKIENHLARADAALYEAKRAGKGRIVQYGAELDRRIADQRELSQALPDAISRGQLALHYRPVADLVTGEITSVEATLKWHHPTRGILSPDTFIPIASATGMIEPIDQFVLVTAARDLAAWRAEHPDLVAWVTVSGRLLLRRDGIAQILAALECASVPADQIGIEVREDAVAQNFTETLDVVRSLMDAGVRVALDDFSGRLTVRQLQILRPHTVKLDREFLGKLGLNVESAKAVRSVIGMIRPLSIAIVAKGVNTPEQLAAVISLNCDGAQGAAIGEGADAAHARFERRSLNSMHSSASSRTTNASYAQQE
jgi:diguanylate cyclase (GGDEF)-like protein/PAS domain S-box-containing protein